MRRKIAAGIDIGTHQVKVMVAEAVAQGDKVAAKVIGTGFTESRGLRHGYILNQSDAAQAIRNAVSQAQKTAAIPIKRALVSIGGIGLSSVTSVGTAVISKADSEVTDLDVEKALNSSQSSIPQGALLNRRIIHTIPLQFKIDGRPVLGAKPTGLKGSKLEVRVLFVTCPENHVSDLIEGVEAAGVEVEDIVAAPIAASLVTLSKTQKIAGCVLANIGAETVSIIVFENNMPVSLETFPIGSNDITNDIALGLKIPLEEAEQIKLGAITGAAFPKKKLDDIIEARLSDIFELVENHLKKIGRSGLLPGGIILTGGGSGINLLEQLAESTLKLPSRVAQMSWNGNARESIRDASWSVAYGLCRLSLSEPGDDTSLGLELAGKAKTTFVNWIKQFLP
jgi:cell division protein FtsA